MKACLTAVIVAASITQVASLVPCAAAPLKVAAFDIEPVDLAKTAEMHDRLVAASALLRKTLAEKGLVIVDLTPQASKIADNLPLSQCNGCDQDIAQALGADIEVATAIQKITSTSYNLSGSVKDVATNRVLRSGVASITGDGIDELNHGVRYLVKERLLDPPLPADAAALKEKVAKAPKPAD